MSRISEFYNNLYGGLKPNYFATGGMSLLNHTTPGATSISDAKLRITPSTGGESSTGKFGSFLNNNAGNVVSGIGGAATLLADNIGFAKDVNTSGIDMLKGKDTTNYSASKDLFSTNVANAQGQSSTDISGLTGGKGWGQVGKSALTGATVGLSAGGPWGALIGAGVGLVSGAAGVLGRKVKADKLAEESQQIAAQKNREIQQNNMLQADRLNDIDYTNMMYNAYADGGSLNNGGRKLSKYDLMLLANGHMFKAPNFGNAYALGGPTNQQPQQPKQQQPQRRGTLSDLESQRVPPAWNKPIGKIYADGGALDDFTSIDGGGMHEENALGGVPIGADMQGNPNLAEEGEVVYNDYVFSNRIPIPDEVKKAIGIKGAGIKTFADAANSLKEQQGDRRFSQITKDTIEKKMAALEQAHEEAKAEKEKQEILGYLEQMPTEELLAAFDQLMQGGGQQQGQPSPEEMAMMEQQMAAQQGGQPQMDPAMMQQMMAQQGGQPQMPPEEETAMMQQYGMQGGGGVDPAMLEQLMAQQGGMPPQGAGMPAMMGNGGHRAYHGMYVPA